MNIKLKTELEKLNVQFIDLKNDNIKYNLNSVRSYERPDNKDKDKETRIFFGDLECIEKINCINLKKNVLKIGFGLGIPAYIEEFDNLNQEQISYIIKQMIQKGLLEKNITNITNHDVYNKIKLYYENIKNDTLNPCKSNWQIQTLNKYYDYFNNNHNIIELYLYCHVKQILTRKYTPHFLELKTGFLINNFLDIYPSVTAKTNNLWTTIYNTMNKVKVKSQEAIVLVLEKHQYTLTDILNKKLNNEDLTSIIFQIIYTLCVMNYYGIQHNDLTESNIFITKLDTTVYYKYELEENLWFTVPINYFVKIYDWDNGTLFSSKYNGEGEDYYNDKLNGLFCLSYGMCNEKLDKFDLFTFCNNLYRWKKWYPIFIKFLNQVIVDNSLDKKYDYDGRLCHLKEKNERDFGIKTTWKGKEIKEQKNHICNGPYRDEDAINILTPLQVLLDVDLFQSYKYSTQHPNDIFSMKELLF